jgi:hypothetical protein
MSGLKPQLPSCHTKQALLKFYSILPINQSAFLAYKLYLSGTSSKRTTLSGNRLPNPRASRA